jgi:AbrB family looped-hinge helix DNA binding protein
MEQVTVSSKGQIVIPKAVRDELNLSEGAKLTVEVRGHEIVLSKEPAWRKLKGAASGGDLMRDFAAFRKREREREDSGS